MKTHAKQSIELDHLNLTPAVKTEVSNLIQALLDETKKQANEFKLLEAKNQALMLELAHLRRIR
ncbi:MAG: IS66 family transposase, partial [Nitrosomonas sp.]|nr:IS66 family transposase [Nitrosomonas sp.]